MSNSGDSCGDFPLFEIAHRQLDRDRDIGERESIKDTLIIVPAYNEAKNISGVIHALRSSGVPVEILVIDDGSMDDTANIAVGLGVMLIRHPCNLGYGAALQTGYQYARLHGFRYVIQFDGDGQHNPNDVQVIYNRLRDAHIDMVIGSRFLGDKNFDPGRLKSVAIKVFRSLIWMATRTSITDPTSGLKGLSSSVFSYYADSNRLPPDFPDADFVIDVLLHRWNVVEVPIGNQRRVHGTSMHSGIRPLIYMFKVFISILAVVLSYTVVHRRSHA